MLAHHRRRAAASVCYLKKRAERTGQGILAPWQWHALCSQNSDSGSSLSRKAIIAAGDMRGGVSLAQQGFPCMIRRPHQSRGTEGNL